MERCIAEFKRDVINLDKRWPSDRPRYVDLNLPVDRCRINRGINEEAPSTGAGVQDESTEKCNKCSAPESKPSIVLQLQPHSQNAPKLHCDECEWHRSKVISLNSVIEDLKRYIKNQDEIIQEMTYMYETKLLERKQQRDESAECISKTERDKGETLKAQWKIIQEMACQIKRLESTNKQPRNERAECISKTDEERCETIESQLKESRTAEGSIKPAPSGLQREIASILEQFPRDNFHRNNSQLNNILSPSV